MILKFTAFLLLTLSVQNTYSQCDIAKSKWNQGIKYQTKGFNIYNSIEREDFENCTKKDETIEKLIASSDFYLKAIEEMEIASLKEEFQFKTKNGPKIYVNKEFIQKCKETLSVLKKDRAGIREEKNSLKEYCNFDEQLGESVKDFEMASREAQMYREKRDNEQEHREYYNNGNLKKSGQYDSNDSPTGEWKYYHENGQLHQIGNFTSGKQTGEWKIYHENGVLVQIGDYTGADPTGEHKFYNDDGRLNSVQKFPDGEIIERMWYHENGELKEAYTAASDEWKYYDEHGDLTKIEIYHAIGTLGSRKIFNIYGTGVDRWAFYYESGATKSVGNFTDNGPDGVWKDYYEAGGLEAIGTYIDGKQTGEWKTYHENGQLLRIGKYINDKKTGEWKGYFENGQLAEIDNYIDGKETGESKSYHTNGQLNHICKYTDGKRIGEEIFHHENGQLSSVTVYVDGKAVGESKRYHENGNLAGIVNYYPEGKAEAIFYHQNGQVAMIGKILNEQHTGEWRTYHENGQLSSVGTYIGWYTKQGEWKYYDENGNLTETENH